MFELILVCFIAPLVIGICGGYFLIHEVAIALLVIGGIVTIAGIVGFIAAARTPSRGTSGPLGVAIISLMVIVAGGTLILGTLAGLVLS